MNCGAAAPVAELKRRKPHQPFNLIGCCCWAASTGYDRSYHLLRRHLHGSNSCMIVCKLMHCLQVRLIRVQTLLSNTPKCWVHQDSSGTSFHWRHGADQACGFAQSSFRFWSNFIRPCLQSSRLPLTIG